MNGLGQERVVPVKVPLATSAHSTFRATDGTAVTNDAFGQEAHGRANARDNSIECLDKKKHIRHIRQHRQRAQLTRQTQWGPPAGAVLPGAPP